MTPDEAIQNVKITFWKKTKEGIVSGINTNHKYYIQIQGQLHCTQRSFCMIAFWTKRGLRNAKILKDDICWKEKLLPKLKKFYYDCLLPELIDPRHPRNMPIRNPSYIVDAQKEFKNKIK